MAIVNRSLDASEQNFIVGDQLGAVATNVSTSVGIVKTPGQIREWIYLADGLSSTPSYQLVIQRWTSGGDTLIPLGSAVTINAAYGVSGSVVIGGTLAQDSTLGAVQKGDRLLVNSAVANAASANLMVDVVIRATQDIKKTYDVGQG